MKSAAQTSLDGLSQTRTAFRSGVFSYTRSTCRSVLETVQILSAIAAKLKKRLRRYRRSHRGPVRIGEIYIKVRGQWRYLYRAIDKHEQAVDFLLTAQRDLDVAERFFGKILQD